MRMVLVWIRIAGMFARYFGSRMGVCREPVVDEYYPEITDVFYAVLNWHGKVRFVHPERCPTTGPALFAANHTRLLDPIVLFHGADAISGQTFRIKGLMRDDFFRGTILKTPVFDFDRFMHWFGAFPLSRDKPKLSQLRRVVDHLCDGGGLIVFSGRTRSRSGMLFEYRDGISEPAGVSMFAYHAQRRDPTLAVKVVPVAVTHNPVTDQRNTVYGEALYLPKDASRAEQRQLDFELVEAICGLMEISAPMIVCGLIYLHCLHGRGERIARGRLVEAVSSVVGRLGGYQVDPRAVDETEAACEETIAFLVKFKMISLGKAGDLRLDVGKVLSAPALTTDYRKKNPVKYLANHLMHLGEVIGFLEEEMGNLAADDADWRR